MKYYYKPLLAFLLFMMAQILVNSVGMVVMILFHPKFMRFTESIHNIQQEILTSSFLSTTLIISIILTIALLYLLKIIRLPKAFDFRNLTFTSSIIAITAAILGIFATNILSEFLHLPDIVGGKLTGMAASPIGFFALSIAGPLCEELVFREVILGYSLRKGARPWQAVVFSSLLFGLAHMNPAQVPFAFLIGLILGYIYLRTGNIVLSSIIHIINNSMSCILENILGKGASESTFTHLLGGSVVSIIVLVVCTGASLQLLYCFQKKTANINIPQDNSEKYL